jgi:hypothetical protein
VLLLPAAICFIETKARGHFINEWYLIFVLPGVIALVSSASINFTSCSNQGLERRRRAHSRRW